MSDSCPKCCETLENGGGVPCSNCAKHYHFRCSGLLETTYKKMTADKRASWRCTKCRHAENDNFSELVSEIKSLKKQLQDGLDKTHQGISNIHSNLSAIENRLENAEKRVACAENKIECLPTIETNINNLQSEISELKKAASIREQVGRLNNIEISGIPQRNSENLLSIYDCIASAIGLTQQNGDIDSIFRVRRFTSAIDGNKPADPRPPAIIIRFCRRQRKDEVLAAARARRHLTTVDVGLQGAATPIYLNEHLTVANKILLKRTREHKVDKDFKYLWVRDGKIFLRKDDNSKIYLITEDTNFKKVN